MRRHLYKMALGAISAVLLGHLLAYRFYWYATIYGFDKVVHLFGGIATAYILAALWSNYIEHATTHSVWKRLLLLSFIVGVGWECFEYVIQFFVGGPTIATPIDSVGDVVFDMLGASIATFFVLLIKKRYNTSNER